MAAPAGQTYKYSPLTSRAPIRLLQILSGTRELIQCSLEVVDLSQGPLYDCLSYTWGDPLYHELSAPQDIRRTNKERNFPITCDGLIIYVTENLYEALLQLSDDVLPSNGQHQNQRQRLIWIDAICINQESIHERNSQVAMMNKIYKSAQTVIVWLGISDVHTRLAIEIVNRLASVAPEKAEIDLPSDLEAPEMYSILGIPDIEPQQWLDYAAFLLRTWFSRVWVVQETFVARNIVVWCGSHVLLWSDLTAGSRILKETQLGTLLMEKVVEATTQPFTSTKYVGNPLHNQFIFENMRKKARSLDLERLLAYSRYFNAENERDLVFAVLGMWTPPWIEKKARDYICPDYQISVEQVFALASSITIREMSDLNILSLVEDFAFRTLRTLPSWVPDYTVTPRSEPLAGNPRATAGEERWKASDGLTFEVPIQINVLRLPVNGICFDTIIDFAATEAEITGQYQMKTLLEVLINFLESTYHGRDMPIEAFWRTLIKDTFNGRPAENDARRAFPLLISMHVWELEKALSNVRDTTEDCDPALAPLEPQSLEISRLSELYCQTKALITDVSARDTNGTIPNWDTVQRMIEIGREEIMPEFEDLNRDFEYIAESFRVTYSGRRLFRTVSNYVGIGAQSLQKGDAVWVVAGAAVPIVLRRLPNGNWKLVGEAYVHDIMNGEAVRREDIKLQHICLE